MQASEPRRSSQARRRRRTQSVGDLATAPRRNSAAARPLRLSARRRSHFRFPPLTALADAGRLTAERRDEISWPLLLRLAEHYSHRRRLRDRCWRPEQEGLGPVRVVASLRIRQCRSAGPTVVDASVPECERPDGLAEDRAQQRSFASCSFSTRPKPSRTDREDCSSYGRLPAWRCVVAARAPCPWRAPYSAGLPAIKRSSRAEQTADAKAHHPGCCRRIQPLLAQRHICSYAPRSKVSHMSINVSSPRTNAETGQASSTVPGTVVATTRTAVGHTSVLVLGIAQPPSSRRRTLRPIAIA